MELIICTSVSSRDFSEPGVFVTTNAVATCIHFGYSLCVRHDIYSFSCH
jgi:hypothetical protein